MSLSNLVSIKPYWVSPIEPKLYRTLPKGKIYDAPFPSTPDLFYSIPVSFLSLFYLEIFHELVIFTSDYYVVGQTKCL